MASPVPMRSLNVATDPWPKVTSTDCDAPGVKPVSSQYPPTSATATMTRLAVPSTGTGLVPPRRKVGLPPAATAAAGGDPGWSWAVMVPSVLFTAET